MYIAKWMVGLATANEGAGLFLLLAFLLALASTFAHEAPRH
jgi:hypothetical protein